MELNIQLPTDSLERRRLSNRVAQRKFRQKRQRASIEASQAEGSQPPLLLSFPHNNTLSDHAPSSSTAASASNPIPNSGDLAFGTTTFSYDSSPGLDNINFEDWDQDAMDNIISSASGSLSGGSTYHLDINSPGSARPLPSSASAPTPLIGNASQPIGTQSHSFPVVHPISMPPPPFHPPQPIDPSSGSPPLGKENGWISTLHIAARTGNVRILRVLLRQNVNLDEKDSDGRTPLIHAVIQDQETIVTTLLNQGARINEVDNDQRSALHWAVLHRRENILRVLLEQYSQRDRELDVNAYDVAGWAPIHMAVERGFESGVTMLLECGANLNSKARKCPFAEKSIPGLVTKATV